ncbi:hypothetical protein FB451DRAFT_1194749 [Mycena latifolia]|nr:hypothetical protein FB451DRAFT_1194749 [Mycena latifolia]
MYPLQSSVRSAVGYNDAFALFPQVVEPIGTVPQLVEEWRLEHECDTIHILPMAGDFATHFHSTEILKAIEDLRGNPQKRLLAHGSIKLPFSIEIQHPNCQFKGRLGTKLGAQRDMEARPTKYGLVRSSEKEICKNQETIPLLKQWYTSLKPGDVAEIRIPAFQFRVSRRLTREVQRLWSLFFFNTNIRVDPSAIHLYGPRDRRESTSREVELGDDDESDLLGTILVGLGDTSSRVWESSYALCAGSGEICTHTRLGTWVAFAAGERCSLSPWGRGGYLGFISFRIFRDRVRLTRSKKMTEANTEKVSQSNALASLLSGLHLPCGIFLGKEYVIDAEDLNPFDSQLYKSAQKIADTKLLPVVVNWEVHHGMRGERDTTIESSVYPLTQHHLAFLRNQGCGTGVPSTESAGTDADNDDGSSSVSPLTQQHPQNQGEGAGTDVEWTKTISKSALIPFYTHAYDLKETTVLWKEVIEEGELDEYIKRPRPHTESKTQLGYALVLLPKENPARLNKRRLTDEIEEDGRPTKVAKVE